MNKLARLVTANKTVANLQLISSFSSTTKFCQLKANEKSVHQPTAIVSTQTASGIVVNPLKHDDFFQVKDLVKLDELFKLFKLNSALF